ncbi:MAG: TonB-dependent receptor, partial [Robiginitomaculum sp.]|nr:TonB-dependent receptor [Robiginitomaculum sp.]
IFRANIIKPGGGFADHFERRKVYFDGGNNNVQTSDTHGFSGRYDYDFGDIVFTSITGFESGSSSSVGDIDGGTIVPGLGATVPNGLPSGQTDTDFPADGVVDATTFPGFIPFAAETQDSLDDLTQFTQELRLASDGDGPATWQAGFYYFDTSFNVITVGPGFPPLTIVRHSNDTWAIFGQTSYDISDVLTLTGGIRYTEDNRHFEAPSPPPGPTVNPTDVSDNNVSWDVSALYRMNDEVNLYARVARGFRGPTIQGRDVAFSAFNFTIVDPQTVAQSETIQSYEVGFKSEIMDNSMRLNGAAYHYKISDQQFSIIGGLTNSNQVINADKGVGYGFEADLEWLVTDNFFVQAGFAYNHTEIQDSTLATSPCGSGQCTPTDPLNALGQALIDGNPFPNAPETTLNVFAEYTYPVANGGEVFVNTDWAVQGKTNFFLYTAPEFQTSGNFEGGAQIGYRAEGGRYSALLFVRNLTDEVNLKGGIDFNNLTGFVNEPRVFGAAVTADF